MDELGFDGRSRRDPLERFRYGSLDAVSDAPGGGFPRSSVGEQGSNLRNHATPFDHPGIDEPIAADPIDPLPRLWSRLVFGRLSRRETRWTRRRIRWHVLRTVDDS